MSIAKRSPVARRRGFLKGSKRSRADKPKARRRYWRWTSKILFRARAARRRIVKFDFVKMKQDLGKGSWKGCRNGGLEGCKGSAAYVKLGTGRKIFPNFTSFESAGAKSFQAQIRPTSPSSKSLNSHHFPFPVSFFKRRQKTLKTSFRPASKIACAARVPRNHRRRAAIQGIDGRINFSRGIAARKRAAKERLRAARNTEYRGAYRPA